MPVLTIEDQVVANVVMSLVQTLLATIKARWGTVERWAAEAPTLPEILDGWQRDEVIALMREVETHHARVGVRVFRFE